MRNWIARQVAVLRAGKSGRGLPQSKTWRRLERHSWRASVLECASPLALFLLLPTVVFAQSTNDVPPLRPALPEIPPTLWEQHGMLIVGLSVVAVALLAAAIWWLLQPKPPVPVPIEIQIWRELTALSHELDSSEMLTNLSRCLRRYFSSAFGLPAEGATTTDFNRSLATASKPSSIKA